MQGQVGLEPLPDAPTELADLMQEREFIKKIRAYNSLLQMASSTAEEVQFAHGIADVSDGYFKGGPSLSLSFSLSLYKCTLPATLPPSLPSAIPHTLAL